jgi:hypothetical protein
MDGRCQFDPDRGFQKFVYLCFMDEEFIIRCVEKRFDVNYVHRVEQHYVFNHNAPYRPDLTERDIRDFIRNYFAQEWKVRTAYLYVYKNKQEWPRSSMDRIGVS